MAVSVTEVFAALLVTARHRLAALSELLYVQFWASTIMLAAFCFGAYWAPTLPTTLSYGMFLLVAFASVPVLLSAFLVRPQLGGRQARGLLAAALGRTGDLAAGAVELLLAADEGGGAAGAGAGIKSGGARAELVAAAIAADSSVHEGLQKLQAAAGVAALELDFYRRPLRAPRRALAAAGDAASLAESSLALLLRVLARERGAPDPDLGACRLLAPQLRRVGAALRGCCAALAGLVSAGAPMADALARLRELEEAWVALAAAAAALPAEPGGGGGGRVMLRVAGGLLAATARQARALFAPVAVVVAATQPGAAAEVAAQLEASTLGLVFAAAATLVVVRPANEALGWKALWVLLTVNVAFERCMGGVLDRCLNRLVGTAAAVAYSYATVGLAYAANGGTWENKAPKYAVCAALVTLLGGAVGANKFRAGAWRYAWTVAGIAVPVCVVEGMRAQASPFLAAGYRAACVAIGVAIDAAASSLLLPVTALDLYRENAQRALAALAEMAELVAAPRAPAAGAAAAGEECEREGGGGGARGAPADAAARLASRALAVKGAVAALRGLRRAAAHEGWWPLAGGGPAGCEAEVRNRLLHAADVLVVAVLKPADGQNGPAVAPRHAPLVAAAAAQMAGCMCALAAALTGDVEPANALRALHALDAHARALAAAAGAELAAAHAAQAAGRPAPPATLVGVASSALGFTRAAHGLFGSALALAPCPAAAIETALAGGPAAEVALVAAYEAALAAALGAPQASGEGT
eukprot:scaffold6.g2884.t1